MVEQDDINAQTLRNRTFLCTGGVRVANFFAKKPAKTGQFHIIRSGPTISKKISSRDSSTKNETANDRAFVVISTQRALRGNQHPMNHEQPRMS
jgi:hypothetical protein